MKTPAPLPPQLHGHIFSSAQAREFGIPPKRLRARDIRSIGWGLHQHIPLTSGNHAPDDAGPLPPPFYSGPKLKTHFSPSPGLTRDRLALLTALGSQLDGARFSHSTAALLLGLPLPPRLQRSADAGRIEISRTHTTSSRRFHGLVCHRAQPRPEETAEALGLPISRPGRVLVDLMPQLRRDELVALGDQLIRTPRRGLSLRTRPWESIESLTAVVRRHPSTDGIVAAREALDLIRDGSDSPPETALRLTLIDEGLPEPQLQLASSPGSPWSGDMGWEQIKLVIQYEGAHHFEATQQASDGQRDHAFRRDGWTVLHTNAVDQRQGFPLIRRRARFELGRAGLL